MDQAAHGDGDGGEPAEEQDAAVDSAEDAGAEPTQEPDDRLPAPPADEGADEEAVHTGADRSRLRRLTEQARTVLQELSGADVESVSALERTPSGWRVTLEAVEVRRIPSSTDVLATYDVELDEDGDLVRYRRRRRYARSQSDPGGAE
jgi:hypothetical protein